MLSLEVSFWLFFIVILLTLVGFFVWHLVAFKPRLERTEINNIELGTNALVNAIENTKFRFRVVTGSANAQLWNSDRVIAALRKASENKVKIRIIVGKIDGGKKNKLVDLYNKGILEIKKMNNMPKNQEHFRIADDNYLYIEDMSVHSKGVYKRSFTEYHNCFNLVNAYRKRFNKLYQEEVK